MILALLISLLMAPSGGDVLEQVITSSFAQHYDAGAAIEVEVVRVTGDLDATAALTIDWPEHPPRGTAQLRITDGHGARGWVMMRIRHFEEIAYAARDLAPDDVLSKTDLRFERADVTSFRGEPLSVDGYEAMRRDGELIMARRIGQGRPLRTSDVSLPPLVDVGQSVLMDYQRSGIILRVSCSARERGREGDVIRLYATDTRTTYRARITGPGSAEWIETL